MEVFVFASGSGGNCLLLTDGGTNILIDAGVSQRRLASALAGVGLTAGDIGGVFITHEHSDHISGLRTMINWLDAPVFAPKNVAFKLWGMLPGIERLLRVMPVGPAVTLGGLEVAAFHTSHDTAESVGYRVSGRGIFALATDTGCVTDEIKNGLLGADTALIEANHDEDLLRGGPYPAYLKRRILSTRGHLSNAGCALLAEELAENGTGRIILGHLSRENNRPELAAETVGRAVAGRAELFVAPVSGCLRVPVEKCERCLA